MKPADLRPGEGVIRCPAVRSLIKDGKLNHDELKTAAVQELVRVLSGQDRNLAPNEAGSLANVAGFFAILNHGVPESGGGTGSGFLESIRGLFQKNRNAVDAAAVGAGKGTSRRFDLRLFESPGDHPGTVNFFKNDSAGEFQPAQFAAVMAQVSDGRTLTIDGIAKMIIMANEGRWDKQGSTLDLAKSSGEWALMVCALRADRETTDISVADLEHLYSQADPTRLLVGTRRATAHDWIKVTSQIAAAIAVQKDSAIAMRLHEAFGDINGGSSEKLCPCRICHSELWKD